MAHHFGIDSHADAQWLALSKAVQLGARWMDELLQRFPSPDALLNCSREEARSYGVERLQRDIERATVPDALSRLMGQAPLSLVAVHHPEYPPLLSECQDRPPFLFVHGALDVLRADTLSVVGTRKPSLDGRRAASEFAAAVIRARRVVVSGLALGIDGLAHGAALATGGRTIAILPSGLDEIYPARHGRLADRIRQSGALVSEFPLGTPPRKHHFYRRNRTLSGFSAATLVIEAGRPSGTLLTASAAADQGRDVLALPWSIYHPGGSGCRYLLDDGALMMTSVAALYDYLGAPAPALPDGDLQSTFLPETVRDPDQQAVLTLMGRRSVQPETLAIQLGWELEHCLACLVSLELAGFVEKTLFGYQCCW